MARGDRKEINEGFNLTPSAAAEIGIEEDRRKKNYNIPHSPAIDAAMLTIGAKGNLEEMAAMHNRYSTTSGQVFKYGENENERTVSIVRGDTVTTLHVDNIEKLMGYNAGTKKIFAYVLAKMNEQKHNIFGNKYISFPLQDFVDVGMYSDPRAARVGFRQAMGALTNIKITGQVKKKKVVVQEGLHVIFISAKIERGECKVWVNPNINMEYLAAFYTQIPGIYFALPSKASDLLFNIFRMARQREDDLKNRGYFTISNRNIQLWLGLPDEEKVKDAFGSIKKKIEQAVTDIEEMMASSGEAGSLKLTPIYTERSTIKEYLDDGYLKVEMAGGYVTSFITAADKKDKSKEKEQRRREKIVDMAKAKNLANKIEAQEKKKK